jgi:hypothetical protein
VHEPLSETVRAPAFVLGPSLELLYRTIVVPVVRNAESEEALVAAARLAADRRATIAAVHVLEVPLELPIDAPLPELEAEANDLLEDARGLVEAYGVRVVTRLVRARRAGPAIVEEADSRHADLRPHRRPRASGQPEPRPAHGDPQSGMTPEARLKVTVVLSAVMVVLGVALLIETVVLGGGIGYVLGGMLVVAGAGRLYVSLR